MWTLTKVLFITVVLGLTVQEAAANTKKFNEAHFCDLVAKQLGGITEVKTTYNKRVDILTDTHDPYWTPREGSFD